MVVFGSEFLPVFCFAYKLRLDSLSCFVRATRQYETWGRTVSFVDAFVYRPIFEEVDRAE